MVRDFAKNSFVIKATRDIPAHAELLHVYKSKKWRACFKVLNEGGVADAPAPAAA